MNITIAGARGCGANRTEGGIYLCSGQSRFGLSIDHFILDPVIPWPQEWHRGYTLIKREDGHYDVGIFVSKTDYPSLWDFVAETEQLGASRKIPLTFPFHKLSAGKSNMVFIHQRGILNTWFRCNRPAPLENCTATSLDWTSYGLPISGWHPDKSVCTFAHKDLAGFIHKKKNGPDFRIEGPSYSYEGKFPNRKVPAPGETFNIDWEPAAFLILPLTHIEFPHIENEARETINKAGFETIVTEW